MDLTRNDRPSTPGALLGEVLDAMAKAGRAIDPTIPDPCATCAFTKGTMPNQMSATGVVALHCAMGIDPDAFACHHGMERRPGQPSEVSGDERWPTRLCAGWVAAQLAPYALTKAMVLALQEQLAELDTSAPDPVRVAFDAWVVTLPGYEDMDNYAIGRAYARQQHAPR
jgi:hypothetical protein